MSQAKHNLLNVLRAQPRHRTAGAPVQSDQSIRHVYARGRKQRCFPANEAS